MNDEAPNLPKPTDPMPDERILDRYIAGECTLPERVAFERWMSANPSWRESLIAICYDSEAARDGRADPIDSSAADRRLLMRVGVLPPVASATPLQGRRQADRYAAELDADSLAAGFGTSSVVRGGATTSGLRNISRTALYSMVACVLSLVAVTIASLKLLQQPSAAITEASQVSTYTTGNGQRATIKLPDGTLISLNVASRIRIPANYSANHRVVHLSGEAMFNVQHKSGAPFTVVSGPSTTRVLGTSFVVRHYETDSAAVVAVRDGKVALGAVVLTAGRQATVTFGNTPQVEDTDEQQFSFTQGVLKFRSIPLLTAIPDLNRWYDTDIRVADPALLSQNVDGGFKAGSLTDLASILELMYDVRVVRDGRTLTLYPRG